MNSTTTVTRDDVVAMLATYRGRPRDEIGDELGSLELAWLLHLVEERYGVVLDLTDDMLIQMGTVSGAVAVLRGALAGDGDG